MFITITIFVGFLALLCQNAEATVVGMGLKRYFSNSMTK